MNNEQIKAIYIIAKNFTYVIFFVTTLFIVFNIYRNVSIIGLISSGILSIINYSNAESIIRNDCISKNSMFLIAATFIFSLGCVVCISFILGRTFIRLLYTDI